MADLAPPPPPAGIYAPAAKSAQAWRAIVGWVSVLFGLLVQVLRGTPSMVQFLASVRIRHPSLFSAEGDGDSPAYKPLAAIDAAAVPVFDDDGNDEGAGEERTKRMMIVLDLDETLVCAYDTPSLPKTVRNQAIEAGLKCFDLECLSSEKDADGRRKKNQVTVFERPGLREFLKQTSEFADLVLFTAGLEDYARPVVDKIDLGNKLSRRLYRPATVSTEFREHVKDLSCLSKDLSRVVIVDNNPFSFLLQPLNGIPCVPFSAGQPYDEQLLGVILPLLKHLSQQEDVRTVLHEKFHMPEWFNQNGIPTTFWPS